MSTSLGSIDESIRIETEKAWRILQVNEEVRYFAKRSDGSVLGGRLKTKEALYRAAKNLSGLGYDVYLHLNPSKGPGLKASSQQVTALRHILIDADPVDPTATPRQALTEILMEGDSLLPGTYGSAHNIFTGRGAQGWLCVSGPCTLLADAERATSRFLRSLQQRWAERYGYRIDAVCSDLARIARCPGTWNSKSGALAQVRYEARRSIPVVELLERFPRQESESLALSRPENCSNLIEASPHLNNLARQFLHAGVEEGERHHAAYVAALELLRVGMPFGDTVYWVMRGGNKCGKKMARDEVMHCCEMALKKEANASS